MRRLTEEEIALWAEFAQGVARRRGATLPALSAPPAAAMVRTSPARENVAVAPPRPATAPIPPPLAPIERRLKRDLARGRGEIDSALDLHGLTQAEAHRALRAFLVQAQALGARIVIVVTGKGQARDRDSRSGIEEPGVLRRLAPHWLREPDMRGIVLGFEEAGRAHGGSGALYVRLRRRDRR
jgi:DNA-nicking Smr family endonuclease